MLLECKIIGKQDPKEATKILNRVVSELIRDGKIKLDFPEENLKTSKQGDK
ncbi:hypothetical protein [Clostridium niameyense]|uniref:hypothetical protein n=1 Tax=Clostridium niameyense TaxID=1622073 RepID=UPI000B21DDF3|nr:hypothetical protein [Clostridium niameyense]